MIQQLTQAEQELERVAHITRQALGFFRDNNEPEPIELESLIGSVFLSKARESGSSAISANARQFAECKTK